MRTHGATGPALAALPGLGLVEALEAIHGTGADPPRPEAVERAAAADGPRVIDFGISIIAELADVLTQAGW
ncbi:hypothetical protein [Streptomyces sp. KL110A]|uniref:hypothetical protein n=1 Tax=Streptomyces sp. KL110A TaxID=3384221 RepID=UPI0038CBD078